MASRGTFDCRAKSSLSQLTSAAEEPRDLDGEQSEHPVMPDPVYHVLDYYSSGSAPADDSCRISPDSVDRDSDLSLASAAYMTITSSRPELMSHERLTSAIGSLRSARIYDHERGHHRLAGI